MPNLLRLLRCVPYARLDERAQGSQQRPKPHPQRRRLLPANRPRKGPVRHRLHHQLVRRRGPGPQQPYAPAEPARRQGRFPSSRLPRVPRSSRSPASVPRHAWRSARPVSSWRRCPSRCAWPWHASHAPLPRSSGRQRHAPHAPSRRSSFLASPRWLPVPASWCRCPGRPWRPASQLPRNAQHGPSPGPRLPRRTPAPLPSGTLSGPRPGQAIDWARARLLSVSRVSRYHMAWCTFLVFCNGSMEGEGGVWVRQKIKSAGQRLATHDGWRHID